MTKIRKGQAPAPLTRVEFRERFNVRFYDPAYEAEREAIARLEAIAWKAHQEGRKAPIMRPAGRGFADPAYPISLQWLKTRKRLKAAQKRWHNKSVPSRVLIICGSACNDGTCPGEISKTWRFTESARHVAQDLGADATAPRLRVLDPFLSYAKANRSASGSGGPRRNPRRTSAAIMLKTIPFPPKARTA